MRETKHILYIGHNQETYNLVEEHLHASDLLDIQLNKSTSLEEGLDLLEEKSDLLDLVLLEQGLDGMNAIWSLRREFPNCPVILLIEAEESAFGLEAIKAGAHDFLILDNLRQNNQCQLLLRIIRHAIEESKLRVRLQYAQQLAKAGDWEVDIATNHFRCSQELYRIFEQQDTNYFNTLEDYIQSIYPEDQEIVVRHFLEALQNGDDFEVEHRIKQKDGRIRHVMIQGYALADKTGNYSRLHGITQDITQRKRLEILRLERDQFEQSTKFKQEFLAKTSHEIRTPLNPILLLTDILLNTQPTPQQYELLNAIKTGGEILLAVVNDVLDVSGIEAGKLEFNKNTFRLSDVFSALREMMELSAREKSLDLIFELDVEIPDYIIGDNIRLTQIFLNLIGNAIKFTPKGYIRVEARIKRREDQKIRLEFCVNDTGIGIPEDKLNDIFESFNQVNAKLGQRYHGSGLGLTIVKQLVKLQGGDIFVASKEGEGSTFTFELDFGISEKETITQSQIERIPPDALVGVDILLVEDNPLNQLVTKKIIATWGANIDVANNGRECIEILQKRAYNLILMDLEMPEMDGYEATEYIRTQISSPLKNIPIIAITANALSGMNNKCVEMGMNDYIAKPFEPGQLYAKIIKHALIKETQTMEEQTPELLNSEINGSNSMKKQDQSLPDVSLIIQEFMGTPPYTDLSYLKGISMGDNTIVRKAISRYLKDTPELMLEMENCVQAGDYDQLGKCAHKLKSSVGIMGMDQMKDSMQKIVNICRGDLDKSQLHGLVAASSEVIQASIKELEGELAAM